MRIIIRLLVLILVVFFNVKYVLADGIYMVDLYPELRSDGNVYVVGKWSDGSYTTASREYSELRSDGRVVHVWLWSSGIYSVQLREYPELRTDGKVWLVRQMEDGTYLSKQTTTPATSTTQTQATSSYTFNQVGNISWSPNCGMTLIKLYAADQNGAPVDQIRFKIQADSWSSISNRTGSTSYSSGWTDFVLDSEPKAGTWFISVIGDSGNVISPSVAVVTDTADCSPTGSGHQVATVKWRGNFILSDTGGWRAYEANSDTYAYDFIPPVTWEPNCGLTQAKLYVKDMNDNPVNEIKFHMQIKDSDFNADSFLTGDEGYAPGWSDFLLKIDGPIRQIWRFWVIDDQGNRVSPIVEITTNDADCWETASGHQIASLRWLKKR